MEEAPHVDALGQRLLHDLEPASDAGPVRCGAVGLLKKMKDLQGAFEQGLANAEAATMAMTGATEPSWLLDKPLRGPAGQWVYGQHLGSAQREALLAPVALAPDRDGQLRAELAQRETARAPYLAPQPEAVRITRLATSERHQLEQVSEHLARTGFAARPDLVFGLYRVPDHIDSGTVKGALGSDRLVEWDIVHLDVGALPTAAAPTAVWFDAGEQWVGRRIGEPMVYDEDLALAYLAHAGLGPEHTIGISRHLTIHHEGTSGDSSHTASYVTGAHVWHLPAYGTEAFAQLQANRPFAMSPGPATQVVVLSWSSIRRAVAPSSGKPALAPSPFPYLPSTASELLLAYLGIVGVRAADCYAASVTEDAPKDLDAVTSKAGMMVTTNRGEAQPCVDGTLRPRLVGGARVVIAYRDQPDYAAGRERFAAYQRDVLRSQLELGAERRPLEHDDALDRLPGGLRGLAKATATAGRALSFEGTTVFEKLPPYRYCWPPV